MKIVLTGGGTGGHFYPCVAVAEQLRKIQNKEGIIDMKLYFVSDNPYKMEELERLDILYKNINCGKLRTYFSLHTIVDVLKSIVGVFQAFVFIFLVYPDAVFCKGGFASFPIVLASIIFRIPIVVHESDTVPGRVNKFAGRFAKKVMISFPESAEYFPKEKTTLSGRPIMEDLMGIKNVAGARDFLHIYDDKPVILFLGGSQGAESINNIIVDGFFPLTERYHIIHQTGEVNIHAVKASAVNMMRGYEYADRYKPFDFLNTEGMKRAVSITDLVISRAGSTLFEIASWGKPSILIPYRYAHGNHQHHNAFSYARAGACRVIEESNLSLSVLMLEIENILGDEAVMEKMAQKALKFHKPEAALKIAQKLVSISSKHYKFN